VRPQRTSLTAPHPKKRIDKYRSFWHIAEESGGHETAVRSPPVGVHFTIMIAIAQRVSRAEVRVAAEVVGGIDKGVLLLVAVERGDAEADADLLARKLVGLRIFPGRTPMDLSLKDVGGACLVVSQFTLAGSIRKGNRPSFDRAEDPALAQVLCQRVADRIAANGISVSCGRFGANMDVELVNDGPVTFVIEARDGALAGH